MFDRGQLDQLVLDIELVLLSFWSVAIIHAISFVMWPMDLGHYFFYFSRSFGTRRRLLTACIDD